MKKKTVISSALAVLLCASCFSACGTGDNKIEFGNFWNDNELVYDNINETLAYDVSFVQGSGYNALGYEVSYSNGTYVTTLESITLPNGGGYKYTTTLEIDVTYQYKTDEPVVMHDRIYTETLLYDRTYNLRPVSSLKQVLSHSPASDNANPKSSEECCVAYNYSVETIYPAEGDAVTTITNTSDPENIKTVTQEFSASSGKYSVLDNETLLLALRAIPASVDSATVKMYSPYVERMQKVALSFSDVDEDEGQEFKLSMNGAEAQTYPIAYRSVTLKLNETNSGATQTAWIAQRSQGTKNTHHNVMLRLETPIAYSIGSLVYELRSINR